MLYDVDFIALIRDAVMNENWVCVCVYLFQSICLCRLSVSVSLNVFLYLSVTVSHSLSVSVSLSPFLCVCLSLFIRLSLCVVHTSSSLRMKALAQYLQQRSKYGCWIVSQPSLFSFYSTMHHSSSYLFFILQL